MSEHLVGVMNTQKYLTTQEQLGLMHKHQQFPDQKTLEKKMNVVNLNI